MAKPASSSTKKAPKTSSDPKKTAGRPSIFSDELAARICDELADGKSLVEICAAEDMPHRRTVLRWMESKPDFATLIARTREGPQADHLLESMSAIEKKVLEGTLDPQAARVVIWSRQWRAGKLAPKKYGEKLELSGNPENPLKLLLSQLPTGSIKPVDEGEDE